MLVSLLLAHISYTFAQLEDRNTQIWATYHNKDASPFWRLNFTVLRPKIWPPQISLKLKFYYLNQGPWTWNRRNYINISHRKKVYLVNLAKFSWFPQFPNLRPKLLNKLFSNERYWCNFFCFMFRDLDLDNKISISSNLGVVKFLTLLLWNFNFKWPATSFCEG